MSLQERNELVACLRAWQELAGTASVCLGFEMGYGENGI